MLRLLSIQKKQRKRTGSESVSPLRQDTVQDTVKDKENIKPEQSINSNISSSVKNARKTIVSNSSINLKKYVFSRLNSEDNSVFKSSLSSQQSKPPANAFENVNE
jgi:hypothetical protein